ncbi:hypothetical protein ACMT1E_04440 [Sphingomonas flavalba]|uniref:hypothetical protein n=1 Tax=Sphingomonas flavalba TaxID=2559804 RepID=UPI0039DF56BF
MKRRDGTVAMQEARLTALQSVECQRRLTPDERQELDRLLINQWQRGRRVAERLSRARKKVETLESALAALR